MRAALVPVLLTVTLLVGHTASADVTKADCVKANADAQTLRLKGLFGGARDKLTLCADPTCPGIVRDDCTQRLDELEHVQPTVVFEAKDSQGADVLSVSVTVDGQPLTDKLSGTALRVDPGEHTFTFRAEGRSSITRTFVIHEGEKDRRERVEFPVLAMAAPPATGSAEHGLGTQRVLALTSGGLAVAGVVVGSIFGVLSTSAASRQDTDCASPTSCLNHAQALSDHSTAATDGGVSTAAFVLAGVFLAAGVTLFFLPSKSASEQRAGHVVVTPSVGPGSASLLFRWGS
jgi:hypothetical protein